MSGKKRNLPAEDTFALKLFVEESVVFELRFVVFAVAPSVVLLVLALVVAPVFWVLFFQLYIHQLFQFLM